jgi:Spy/CpxP family protein refolding chaperone
MRKLVVALALAAVVVLGVTYVYAIGPGYGRTGWGFEGWSSLAPEQQTKFQELRQKLDNETAQLRGTIVTKRLELQSLWSDPKADPKAIQEKEKELRSLQDQMRDKTIQFRLEARKVLTPEQLTQLGPGRGIGPGLGGGRMMGYSPGTGCGYRRGPGYGRNLYYGTGPSYGPCYY